MSLTTIAIVGWCAIIALVFWAYYCDKQDKHKMNNDENFRKKYQGDLDGYLENK